MKVLHPLTQTLEEIGISKLRDYLAQVPLLKTLGFTLTDLAPGDVGFEGVLTEGLTQSGILHGGVLAAILDSACAAAAISMVFPGAYATTVALQVNYLRSITRGRFYAKGTCIKSGRNVFFSEASAFAGTGELLATASSQLIRVPAPDLSKLSNIRKIK